MSPSGTVSQDHEAPRGYGCNAVYNHLNIDVQYFGDFLIRSDTRRWLLFAYVGKEVASIADISRSPESWSDK